MTKIRSHIKQLRVGVVGTATAHADKVSLGFPVVRTEPGSLDTAGEYAVAVQRPTGRLAIAACTPDGA